MTEQRSPVAVVGGTGHEGGGLALRWAAAGVPVLLGSRDRGRAEAAAHAIAERVAGIAGAAAPEGLLNEEAVQRSRLVVLTVPFAAQARTLKDLHRAWQPGTTLVDCTVPLAVAVGGSVTQMLYPWAGSAAEQAAALVPPSVAVCAAFHHVAADALAALGETVDCDVLVCGDSRDAKRAMRRLVSAIPGARYVDAGALERARFLEPIAALLIALNLRHKVHGTGIRFTGLPLE